MSKALRALVVGSLFTSMLAACGSAATTTGTASVAPSAASVAASVAPSTASVAASTAPSVAASTAAASAATSGSAVAAEALPEVDAGTLSGDVITAGSSTVFPLSQRMAERFRDEGFGGNVTVDSIGSGAGFERFCTAGETDIANASRAIKEEEIANCAKLSPPRTPIEFRVGTDAVVVAVSSANDFVTELDKEQLAKLFSTAASWNEIDPSFPNQPIKRFIPGTDSGTFDFFAEKVFDTQYKAKKEDAYAQLLNAANVQASEDDNVLVQGIEGDAYSVGFFGFAYFKENASKLKALTLDGQVPDEESAESGAYELSRPLFIYSDAAIMQEKPQVAAFINFYLTNVNDEIGDVGYFPASEETLNAAKQAWLATQE